MFKPFIFLAVLFVAAPPAMPCEPAFLAPFKLTEGTVVPPRMQTVVVDVKRKLSTLTPCFEAASVAFHFQPDPSRTLRGVGVRLKLVSGRVPFQIPPGPFAITPDGFATQSWFEEPGHVRPPIHARLAARFLAPDGSEGPWQEFDLGDDEKPPVVFVHPFLVNALRLVVAGGADKLVPR